jgi:hypothetical protein
MRNWSIFEPATPRTTGNDPASRGPIALKFAGDHPYADPDKGARKLVEIANGIEAVQDGRIHVEKVNAAFLGAGGSVAEYKEAVDLAITKGWLWKHESGTYVKFTPAGAELFA